MPIDMASNSTVPEHLLAADADAVYEILKIALEAGIDVPTATRGPATIWHALEPFPELGEQFRSREGRKRLAAAVTQLMREKRIIKESYKKGNLHDGEYWVLADETGAVNAAGALLVVEKMCADISPIPLAKLAHAWARGPMRKLFRKRKLAKPAKPAQRPWRIAGLKGLDHSG